MIPPAPESETPHATPPMPIRLTAVATIALFACSAPVAAQILVVGSDAKVTWNEQGKPVFRAPGKDTISIIDISNREQPRVVAGLALPNSVFGPPTNIALTPDERLALVANALDWVKDGETWVVAPDNKVSVIDLKAIPPRLVATLEVGKQPSGIAINAAGTLALVANRVDPSISVLAISGSDVKVVDTVEMDDQVAHVAFTPDGTRALAAKFTTHKAALLVVDGQKVTNLGYDVPVGPWPYNIAVAPNGKIALTANTGSAGTSDGHVDTVSVIDLELRPPRVTQHVSVGDAPEGLAISPTGKIAVAVLIKGSNAERSSWAFNRNGSVAVLELGGPAGKLVRKIAEVPVRGIPQGVAFSPDGGYIYVANFRDENLSILKVDGTKVTDTKKTLKLPGPPASLRSRLP
jgi:DNA-binding beta-propeller fold protein YncE